MVTYLALAKPHPILNLLRKGLGFQCWITESIIHCNFGCHLDMHCHRCIACGNVYICVRVV